MPTAPRFILPIQRVPPPAPVLPPPTQPEVEAHLHQRPIAVSLQGRKCRSWVFTLNNPTAALVPQLDNIQVEYLLYAPELSATGTPHFQGVVEFKGPKTLVYVKKFFLPHLPHLEMRRGTKSEAVLYCLKVRGMFTSIFYTCKFSLN